VSTTGPDPGSHGVSGSHGATQAAPVQSASRHSASAKRIDYLCSVQGIAWNNKGMGPGDDMRFMADYYDIYGLTGDIEVGLTIEVTIGIETGAAFYNAGEIQVRGPLSQNMYIATVKLPDTDLPVLPREDETTAYTLTVAGVDALSVTRLPTRGAGELLPAAGAVAQRSSTSAFPSRPWSLGARGFARPGSPCSLRLSCKHRRLHIGIVDDVSRSLSDEGANTP
jgi:hypothetical protein